MEDVRMNISRVILLGAVICSGLLMAPSLFGQAYNARQLTRKVVPQPIPAKTNAPGVAAQPAPVAPAPPNAIQKRVITQAVVRYLPPPPVDPEKARASREQAIRKTIEFQKMRAEEGSESAQYELGLRYLKGDGLEKDETLGRKWLTESSKNGYGPATRKLEELDKPAEPAHPETK